jgi:5'-3' exonuclease
MGIYGYYSSIIKSHPSVTCNIKSVNVRFSHLFMDCNSIIYDAYREIVKKWSADNSSAAGQAPAAIDEFAFYNSVISNVIQSIENYITIIRPTDLAFIAFDGVAPYAKMEQQRNRRYKTHFLNKVSVAAALPSDTGASHFPPTAIITPGTKFMILLSETVARHFANRPNVIVSASNDTGEGEHKMFQYMRSNDLSRGEVAIYGLDSDLIMLSLFHIHLCLSIHIFREAHEFMKYILPSNIVPANPKEPYFLNIAKLADSIIAEMDCAQRSPRQIHDYIFVCFLLGNDFLPNFPALPIRTSGINTLLCIYKQHIGCKPDRSLVKDGNINWRWVSVFIGELAKLEKELIVQEYVSRNKFDNYRWSESTPTEKENVLNNMPVINRAEEKYIHPVEEFWEERYYKSLFKAERTKDNIKDVCNNYLEGLDWVFKYYTVGCPDWMWKYRFNYAPLLCDLTKFVPHFYMDFITACRPPVSPNVQLAYVLPPEHLHLLSSAIREILASKYAKLYTNQIEFVWAFKRYLYESHCVLPDIPIDVLHKWKVLFEKI